MTSNVDIMYDAISEVLSDCDRMEARADAAEALLASLLEALSLGPLDVAAKYGPDAHPDEAVIDAAHKARAFLAETAPTPVRLGDEGEG